MPWNIPPTWSAGVKDQPTLTDYNQLLRDNPNYLLGGKDIAIKDYLGGDKTTTGTSFAVVSTTDFRLTSGVINSGRYMVYAWAEWGVTTLNNKIFADVYVDATTRANNGDSTNGVVSWNMQNVNTDRMFLMAYFTGLITGITHVFDIYWKVSAGTGTFYTGSAALHMIGMEV